MNGGGTTAEDKRRAARSEIRARARMRRQQTKNEKYARDGTERKESFLRERERQKDANEEEGCFA